MAIQKRRLGKTGVELPMLGLGGEGLLRTFGREKEAHELINTALDLGISYMESARAYSKSESYYGASLRERRKDVFLASKSHARDKAGALAHLRETLTNMKTDYLDLWQVHDVRTEEDIKAIFGPGGAMEAFREAKEKGQARFIGVTGHHDPVIIRKCLEAFDFDTALIPVNPAEPCYKCFLEEIMPAAGAKDVGILAMKVYLRNLWNAPKRLLLSYALSQPVAIAVVGCDDVAQLKENVEAAGNFQALKLKEVQRLKTMIAPYAKELMFYKP
ncbi:MAG: aldo/keto reductase [Deltaproteobacteria bacterium]|nr:aldo/keto reductase [Deltaproteobacteria bacterium]